MRAFVGWLGLALAVVSLISGGSPLAGPGGFFDAVGYVASIGLGIWILIVSVGMCRSAAA